MSGKGFAQDVLQAHNAYRAKHHAPALTLNRELADHAQKWADHLAKNDAFEHSKCTLKSGETIGENVAMKWSSSGEPYTGQAATDQWYSEIANYDFDKGTFAPNTGHFTQVVWRDSLQIGVGRGQTKSGKWIVVANYLPAGNVMGRFRENVISCDGPVVLPQKEKETASAASADGETKEVISREEIKEPDGTVKVITKELITKANGEKYTLTRTHTTRTVNANDASDKMSSMNLKDGKKGKKPQKLKDFIEDCVKHHNSLRKKHGASSLKHSKELDVIAQKWAEHLVTSDSFAHSAGTYKGEELGENLACKWSSSGDDYTGEEAANQWYSEISKYDFKKPDFTPGTGHFTQVVWKDSKEIGVGKAQSKDGKVVVVANYRPGGNVIGRFAENVPALK